MVVARLTLQLQRLMPVLALLQSRVCPCNRPSNPRALVVCVCLALTARCNTGWAMAAAVQLHRLASIDRWKGVSCCRMLFILPRACLRGM